MRLATRGRLLLLGGMVMGLAVTMTATAQEVSFATGNVPPPGGIGLMVASRTASPGQITDSLRQAACDAESLAILTAGSWSLYIPGAPAATNVAFPSQLVTDQPFFVRCRRAAVAGPPLDAPPVGPLPIGISRHNTYEPGEERVETAQANPGGLGVSTEAARLGRQAGFALLREGDARISGGTRAEWHGGLVPELGDEYTYGVSYFVPRDWNSYGKGEDEKRIIFQFHEVHGYSFSPIYAIKIDEIDNELRIIFYKKMSRNGPDRALWTMPLVTETWVDFAINVKWTDDDNGHIRFYRNGQLVYEALDIATLKGPVTPYPKWGVYGEPARILFDEVRIAPGPPRWEHRPN